MPKRFSFTITTEPRGLIYRALLNSALPECKIALLVVRHSLPLSDVAKQILEELRPFLKVQSETSEWPGTILRNKVATVFQYEFGPQCVEVLKTATDRLYGWVQPRLPEDLCLLREKDDPWLVSISHEEDSYLCLSEEERERLTLLIPELAGFLNKDA